MNEEMYSITQKEVEGIIANIKSGTYCEVLASLALMKIANEAHYKGFEKGLTRGLEMNKPQALKGVNWE